jgi:ribosomal protein S18 acetylase RimI-like enzyme
VDTNPSYVIPEDRWACYLEEFQGTVRGFFPALGFTPDQVEDFISRNTSLEGDQGIRIEAANGRIVFGRVQVNRDRWQIRYLIPSSWAERYCLLRQTLEQIKQDFLRLTPPKSTLTMVIQEPPPSFSMYFAGLLPSLGFDLTPRAQMGADLNRVCEMPLPSLPLHVEELSFQRDHLPELIEFFHQAFKVYPDDGGTREGWAEIVNRDFEHNDAAASCVILRHKGQVVGASYGRIVVGDVPTLLDLAVASEWHGCGLGKFLVVQCARRLKEHQPGVCRDIVLYTLRAWPRAVGLYCSAGFRFTNLWTEVSLVHGAAATLND